MQELNRVLRVKGGWRGDLDYVAPPSKSYSHRSLLISAISEGTSRIINLSKCEDVESTLGALKNLGVKVELHGNEALVEGLDFKSPSDIIDCGGSASTLRMLAPIVAARESYAVYTGNESLLRRPVGMLEEALRSLGVETHSNHGRPPLTVKSRGFSSNTVVVNASESSQHVSGFLIAGTRLEEGFTVVLANNILVSKPYVDLTVSMLRMHGVEVKAQEGVFRVEPGRPRAFNHYVPGDYSLAAIPLAMVAVSGCKATVHGLVEEPQPDSEIVEMLRAMGLKISWLGNTLIAERVGKLRACVLDCSNTPDLVPALALAATAAEGETVLKNISRIEIKESARATLIVENLSKMGVETFLRGGDLVVKGPCKLKGTVVDAGRDHRIEMMLIAAGAFAEGETTIVNAGSVSKSNPGFYDWIEKAGVELQWA
ncbi:MAG: 3-phosphoshikimate 1-carboxyvinyltransferase [Thermoproteota archaeon]